MIKRRLALAAALAATALPLHALETYLVVKLGDRAGEDTYEVMSQEDFKAAEREVRDEGKLVRKALDLAKKAWKENPEHKNAFPNSAISARQIRTVGRYKDQESASEKCATYVERIEKSKAEREKKEKERESRGSRGRRGGDKERQAEKARRERERDAEREALQQEARDIYEKILEELKAGSKPKPAGK